MRALTKKKLKIAQAHCDIDEKERKRLRQAFDKIIYEHLDTIQPLSDCSSPAERKEYLATISENVVSEIYVSTAKLMKALKEIEEKGTGRGGKNIDSSPRGFALWLDKFQQQRYGTLGCNLRGRKVCQYVGFDIQKGRRLIEALKLRLTEKK